MTSPDTPGSPGPRRGGAPLRAWTRSVLLLLGGALATVLLVLADQLIAAIAVAVFSLFMAYWTSPLRSGPHAPLETALARRADDVVIILWAPGNPLSARLQTAIRGERDDVVWVNVYQDPRAQQLLAEHGGAAAAPLVIVGDQMTAAATVAQLLELQEAGRRRAAGDG
ncbi:hypothetical protein [Brachybacterium fresconis]|uniref:Uncharacterized protein n=1 Tax=Brachybacterium fresconis TaxID=173363 RepID=A0ABS4YM40_9MICO|nr:hypothetical protein [Brachybacterium fresconis]MBP2409863.1 hypothetical protein [Brachybacterium fresconis]